MVAGAEAPSREALDAHLREQVYATHIPIDYRVVDALPRTPSLKIDLPAVKAIFAEDRTVS